MNPYEVLGVPENASDEEIRAAYRKQVKRYHPDQFQDNPLKELATEKLKEVNEAYEMLSKRSGPAQNSGGYSQQSSRQYSGSASFAQVQAALSRNDLRTAESLLLNMQNRTAEWHYLMGVLRLRQGNANMARGEFETATRMEPNNPTYRQAYESLMSSGRTYSTGGVGGGTGLCTLCAGMYLTNCCCQCLGGNMFRCC